MIPLARMDHTREDPPPVGNRFAAERRRLVSSIFVDDTMVSIRDVAWLGIASALGLRAFFAFRVSYNQSIPMQTSSSRSLGEGMV